MLALAAGLVAFAASVAVVCPAVVGAYWTVTLHDLRGPRAVPVQASAVIVNSVVLPSETLSAPVAAPPEFLSVNVCDAAWPTLTAP